MDIATSLNEGSYKIMQLCFQSMVGFHCTLSGFPVSNIFLQGQLIFTQRLKIITFAIIVLSVFSIVSPIDLHE